MLWKISPDMSCLFHLNNWTASAHGVSEQRSSSKSIKGNSSYPASAHQQQELQQQAAVGRKAAVVRRRPLVRTALFLLSLAVYWNSLPGDLVFDDITAIRDNKDLRDHVSPLQLWSHDFWGAPIHSERSHKSYRPLTVLTFRWNYYQAGGSDHPVGFHAVNVLLHAVVTLLYYELCRKVAGDGHTGDNAAVVAAFVFAVHPVHTEAVAGVVGRAELLSSFWFLLSLFAYISACISEQETSWPHFAASIVCATLAMLSKEQGITALGVCAAYDIFSFPLRRRRRQIALTRHRLFALGCLVALLLLGRWFLMGGSLPAFSRFDNPAASESFPVRQLTHIYLVAFNCFLLLSPIQLCCDWTMDSIPLVQRLGDSRNVISALTGAVLAALVAKSAQAAFVRRRRMTRRTTWSGATLFALSLLVVPFLPASNLLFPVGFVVAERVLYLPSMGFCLLVAIGFNKSVRLAKCSSRRVLHLSLHASFILLLYVFMCKTLTRNLDWRNEMALFSAGLKVVPTNTKLWNNVGRMFESGGNLSDALVLFRHAAALHPDHVGSHVNIGRALAAMGRPQEAEEALVHAKRLLLYGEGGRKETSSATTGQLNVFVDLATLIAKEPGRLEEAERIFAEAIALRKDFTPAYLHRAEILVRMNRTHEAQMVYERALDFTSDDPDLLFNLGIVLLSQNQSERALHHWEDALRMDPDHPHALLNSAMLIIEEDHPLLKGVAMQRLRRLVQLERYDEQVLFHLGMLCMDAGLGSEAKDWLEEAVVMRRDFRAALFNLALLLSKNSNSVHESEHYLRQLLQHHPDHVKGLFLLGDLYVNYLQDLQGAESAYDRVLELEPENVHARHNLCVVLVEQGRLQEAKDCLQETTRLAPEEAFIRRSLQIVEKRLSADEQQ